MKTKFRIRKDDTIKATMCLDGKLVSQVYDSGFTTIKQVIDSLNSKVSDYNRRGGEVDIMIYNQDKDELKCI